MDRGSRTGDPSFILLGLRRVFGLRLFSMPCQFVADGLTACDVSVMDFRLKCFEVVLQQ